MESREALKIRAGKLQNEIELLKPILPFSDLAWEKVQELNKALDEVIKQLITLD